MRYYLTKSHNLYKTLAFLCFMVLPLLLINGCKKEQSQAPASTSTTQSQENKKPIMRIAFVGNEYIQNNNMANMVQLMAQSNPSAHFTVEVGLQTMQQASLAQLWQNPMTKENFPQDRWDYWMHAINTLPEINLYAPDSSSPSLEGSFLTALVIYKTLVDGTLNDVAYIPEGISQETKDTLTAIASAKVAN